MRRLYIALVVLVATLAFAAAATARPAPKRAAHDRAGTTQPDQVIQWNRTLLQLLQTPGAQPATVHPTRTMAITQLAVYDAVVAIEGVTRSYLPQRPVLRPSSPAAAAAGAAHRALLSLFPGQRAVIDAKFQASLAQLGSSDRVRAGVRVGERAARAVLTARARDHSGAPASPFTPAPGPGEYQLTPPAFGQPVFTNWAAVTPFVLKRASEFRPPPPPAVSSPRYSADFDEVKSLGSATSATRSAEQTEIARFWGAAPVQNVWNEIAQTAGLARHNTLGENARMFALLDTGMADGVIALYDAKYAYHRWRPVTAVQTADNDGNPETAGDPGWTPLAATAPDPSYVGAHAEISASAAAVLREVLGTDRLDFSLTTPSLPGVTRSFASFSQAAGEASASRIYAGQHFRYDEDAGEALGDEVGDFVAHHILATTSNPRRPH